MDYQNINQKIVTNSYLLPRICGTIRQLEGFKYAIPLDLNMGYHMRLFAMLGRDQTSE